MDGHGIAGKGEDGRGAVPEGKRLTWPLGHTMESGRPEKRLDNWSHKVVLPSGYSTAEKEEIRIEPGADCGCGGVGTTAVAVV